MMGSFYDGILLGLTLSILFGFGPALFALIQTSIHRGFLSGVILAVGIFLSDVALVALCFFGAVKLISTPENYLAFGIISGGILIIFGVVTFYKRVKVAGEGELEDENTPGPVTYLLKGFFLNIANPFVWIFWMGVVMGVTASVDHSDDRILKLVLFFSGTLITVIVMDILKCFGSYKIKKYLTGKFIDWVNRITGVGLVGFGIYLIIKSIAEF